MKKLKKKLNKKFNNKRKCKINKIYLNNNNRNNYKKKNSNYSRNRSSSSSSRWWYNKNKIYKELIIKQSKTLKLKLKIKLISQIMKELQEIKKNKR